LIPSFLRGSVALCGILFFISAVPLRAQTAGELEALLESPAVTRGEAARFVLGAADLPGASGGGAAGDAAFALAVERGWLSSAEDGGGPIRLDEAAFLLLESSDGSGGLLYGWFKTPHYAYRELRYREVIPGRTDPAQRVSGDLLLFMMGRMEARREAEEAALEALSAPRALAFRINRALDERGLSGVRAHASGRRVTVRIDRPPFLDEPERNRAALSGAEQAALDVVAPFLDGRPELSVTVLGQTARSGRRTSLLRARLAAEYLGSLGFPRPVAVRGRAVNPEPSGSWDQGMIAGRRTDIIITVGD
jgi:hypothetical protein